MIRFRALDSWRGIAALLVALHHSRFYGHIQLNPLVENAYLCVDLFFVLSGFVLTHAFRDKLQDGTAQRGFILRRIGRLWPLHLAVLLFLFAEEALKYYLAQRSGYHSGEAPFTALHSPSSFIANIFLVQALGLFKFASWNGPAWSISVEFYTNLIFLLIAAFGPRMLRLAALPICGGALLILYFHQGAVQPMDIPIGFSLFRCLFGFFTGVMVYEFYARCRERRIILKLAPLAEIASVMLAFIFIILAGHRAASLLAPLAFAPLLFVFAFEAGPLSQLLLHRGFLWLGILSYSIYLIHYPVFNLLVRASKLLDHLAGFRVFRELDVSSGIATRADLTDAPLVIEGMDSLLLLDLLNIACLLLVIGLSFLTYALIEQPGRRYFNRLAGR